MKHRLTDGSGYLMIDHTNSPGIKFSDIPDRLKSTTPVMPEGKVIEADVQFCTHCGREIILAPDRKRPRGHCQKCHHYICDLCSIVPECNSLKRLFDTLQNKLVKNPDIILTDSL
jgi:ribosomal protein S27AE